MTLCDACAKVEEITNIMNDSKDNESRVERAMRSNAYPSALSMLKFYQKALYEGSVRFGFSPSDRARLDKKPPEKKPSDPAAKMFGA
jgi:hypothetical protein